jgi:hypothetical protein
VNRDVTCPASYFLFAIFQGQPRISARRSPIPDASPSGQNAQASFTTSTTSSSTTRKACAEQTQNILGFPGSFKVTVSVTDTQAHHQQHQQLQQQEHVHAPVQVTSKQYAGGGPDASEEDEEDDDEEDDDRSSVILKNSGPG